MFLAADNRNHGREDTHEDGITAESESFQLRHEHTANVCLTVQAAFETQNTVRVRVS